MNFFAPKTAAERYVKGRPFFHPLIINRVRDFISLTAPVNQALDVGCGTGLSSLALREIASSVTGVDASVEMISRAPGIAGINYVVARAEQLPLRDESFTLMTLSQVFHWLDSARFFSEARRILRTDGWLVVYDNYMTGQMEGCAGFQTWFRESFKVRYPRPVRAWNSFDEKETEQAGFRLLSHEWLPNKIRFSAEGLADHFLSLSNVIAAVEGGGEDADEVKAWILESVRPFFADVSEAEFEFQAPVWFLRKA